MEVPGVRIGRNVSAKRPLHETSADAPWARPYQKDCALQVIAERHVKVLLHKGRKACKGRAENKETMFCLPARPSSRSVSFIGTKCARFKISAFACVPKRQCAIILP